MYLSYLKSWPLDTAPCILDKRASNFYIQEWEKIHNTNIMKEIIQQLKATTWKRN